MSAIGRLLALGRLHGATAPTVHEAAVGLTLTCCRCRLGRRAISQSAVFARAAEYDEVFKRSLQNPTEFWAEAADGIEWHKKWKQVLDNSNPPFTKWFVGGELNTCHNAVDRHVAAGRGDQAAIIHDSPVSGVVETISYRQLLDQVSRFAGVLAGAGVEKGDGVLIYMPMIPQAIVAMLASARLGAIHSLVFGGFGSKELATRIQHAEPKVVVSANCGIEPSRLVPYKPLLNGALELSSFKPKHCIIFQRPGYERASMTQDLDLDWDEEMQTARARPCEPVPATDPVYLLYTSGTTGLPKAVVRPSGGHAVVLNWSMSNVYGLQPGDVWWAASDLGWVVGHSYIAYAPLLHGNTTVLFEGKPVGTPDAGTFFRVMKQHKVRGMFTAPTALRAIRAEDFDGVFAKQYLPLDNLHALFVAGEHCDSETMMWAKSLIQKPILDNWWQTVRVLNHDGDEAADNELGQIVVKLPLPPCSFSSLWKGDIRFKETYFRHYPGYYDTMDAGFRDAEGYISVMARSDDVINVAGHRLSTGALEEAILESEDVVEAAVIGIPHSLKGQIPLGLCVLKHGVTKTDEEVIKDVVQVVRESIGPVASFKVAIIVPKLPKTRSGKVARNTLAAMAAGKPFQVPVLIEDASVYEEIRTAMEQAGFCPSMPED